MTREKCKSMASHTPKQFMILYLISLTQCKVHFIILANGIHYHNAKIVDSFKLLPVKANHSASVHFHIRHTPNVHLFLNYSSLTSLCGTFFVLKSFDFFILVSYPVYIFMRFNKAHFRCSECDVILFLSHFLKNYAF